MPLRAIRNAPALATLAIAFGLSSLALSSVALSPQAAQAQSRGTAFRAELSAPATEARVIAGGVLWACAETTCTAPQNGKRPLRVCRELRREMGPITSFEAGGELLDADTLARCNG